MTFSDEERPCQEQMQSREPGTAITTNHNRDSRTPEIEFQKQHPNSHPLYNKNYRHEAFNSAAFA
jgi:hypothetical protein